MNWIGMPIRFAIWLAALLIIWPFVIPAMLIFAPGMFTVKNFLRVQRDSFREFVLWEW